MNWFKKVFIKYAIDYYARSQGGKTMIAKIVAFLDGKKAYLVALGMIIAAVIQYLADQDMGKLVNKVMEALALIFVRGAIAKTV
jgi:type IV secretory pathway VirB2 component (pilin)